VGARQGLKANAASTACALGTLPVRWLLRGRPRGTCIKYDARALVSVSFARFGVLASYFVQVPGGALRPGGALFMLPHEVPEGTAFALAHFPFSSFRHRAVKSTV